MKLTRPAMAAVAAVAIAAASVPAVGALHGDAPTPIKPADLQEETSVLAAPTTTAATSSPASSTAAAETTAAVTTVVETATTVVTVDEDGKAIPEDELAAGIGGSVPDGDGAGLPKVIEDQLLNPDTSGEGEENMPADVEAGASADALKPVEALTKAPTDYKGQNQFWFNAIKNFKGGEAVKVWSPSMERYIPVALIRATDANGNVLENAPTYYLLNGAGGSEQNTDWIAMAGETVSAVLENEPVNVVIPMEGAFSYYVNWLSEPDVSSTNPYYHGKQMWSTFLGSELPESLEKPYLKANGKRAVSGFSMSATSSLLLAEHNPQKYAAVGSFSGCAATSTSLPSFFVGLTVNRGSAGSGNVTPAHIWGPLGSEYNRYNDALVMADGLANTDIYLSAGTGLPGKTDMAGFIQDARKVTSTEASSAAMTLQVEGGAIEAAMNACTHDLNAKLGKVPGARVHFNKRPTGTHSWPLWRDDLKVSWEKVIRPALLG